MSAYGDVLDFSESGTVVDSQGHEYKQISPVEVIRLK
jgi:UDP-2-acetamido-3-amino-2,3-dideoxy-glucuronate N-acetyltransferase